ncbi:hypothetical protein ACF0H5_012026 [Mactra antiquata]
MFLPRTLSLCFLLATIFIVSYGLICQFPHCERVKCDPLPENCSGTVKMGGGYCGCCMACFTQNLGQDDDCVVENRMFPPTALCKTGLYCDYNSTTCQEIPGFAIG